MGAPGGDAGVGGVCTPCFPRRECSLTFRGCINAGEDLSDFFVTVISWCDVLFPAIAPVEIKHIATTLLKAKDLSMTASVYAL